MKTIERETKHAKSGTPATEGKAEPCDLCSGTGLVCRNAPIIDSKNCCVDYANAVCAQCNGAGVMQHDD